MRQLLFSTVILLGAACLLLGGAFLFREDLARFAAGRFLADGELTLMRLQGLRLTSTQLNIDELEFLLHESGQRLVIANLDVVFRVSSLASAPQVDAISIRSAQLFAADSAYEEREDDPADTEGQRISELLTVLREFPLASVAIEELILPQRSLPLGFELQRGSAGTGALVAQVVSGTLTLLAEFSHADAAADATLTVTLTRAAETVGDFELVLSPMGARYALAGAGRLDVHDVSALLGELEQGSTTLPLQAARLDWTLAGNVADDLAGNAFNAGEAQSFQLGLEGGANVTLAEGLASGLGSVAFDFPESVALTVTSGAGLVLSSSGLPIQVTSTWNGQPAKLETVLVLDSCELAADATCSIGFDGNAAFGEYSVAGVIDADLLGAGRYHVDTQGLIVGGLPEWLPAYDVAADLTVNDEAISFSTPLVLRDAATDTRITVEGAYDRVSSAVDVHATLPELRFTEQGGALSTWFGAWPYAFDLLTGSLAAEADLSWTEGALTGAVAIDLDEAGGFYEEYFFSGVTGALQADVDTSAVFPLHTPPLTVSMAALDIGVPMENLRMDFSLDRGGILHIDAFSTQLLDGTITGKDITYDFNRERNEVLVTFAGLQIERMLELVEYKGIAATGAVSGEIPLTITPAGVEVAEGVLAADAPGGSIRYLAAATEATGNAGLDLMNQALSNYQFESLTSGIEYKPDGELLLEMKLQGHNPEMQGGQRINLNLNLSDNIPALLESLQAARRIEDFLEQQYQ